MTVTPIIRDITIGNCRLIQGDCLEVMPLLGRVDAVVTDPPYGVNLGDVSNGQSRAKQQARYDGFYDTPEYVQSVCVAAIRYCINTWGRCVLTPGLRCAWDYPKPDDIGAWYIPAACSRTKWGFATSQPILYYGKSPRAGIGDYATGVSMSPVAERDFHPCPKPLRFMEWLVKKASLDGEIILDPFMGSGTTGVACVNLGRSFIGIEQDPDYFDICVKRITDAHRQADLFVAKPAPVAPVQESLL